MSDPLLRTCIDSPTPGPLAVRHVILRGWCYHAGERKVLALHGQNAGDTQPARLGFERKDVAEAHGCEAAARSGFALALHLPPGTSQTRLLATLDDGSRHCIAELEFKTPAAGATGEHLRLALLDLLPPAFTRRLWAGLSQPLRDFLLVRLDQHSLLSIGRNDQHAPCPVEAETFPEPSRARAEELPRLDIAMPSLNQGAFIAQAARSVLTQIGVRVNLHVQDGGSTDGTREILASLACEFPNTATRRFSHDSRADTGQAAAINTAFARLAPASCGNDADVMAYLNSDDVYHPGALRFIAEHFARERRTSVAYGHRYILNQDGLMTGRWFTPRRSCDDLRMQDLVPQESLFWRRSAWDKVGGIDETFRFALDWDLLQRMQAAGLRFTRLPWFLAGFRMHPAQKTQAWMESDGTPEMERLRTRAFGRATTRSEFLESMTLGQYDSARVQALWRRGVRA